MIRRETVIGSVLALALAAPAAAQRPSAETDEQQFRYQLQTFEAVLQTAVRHGGDVFARQYAPIIPAGVQLTALDPQVRGFALPPGGSLLFYVAVPTIRPTVSQVLVQWPVSPRPSPMQPASGVARGEDRPSVAATQGLAAPDPMTVSPVVDDGRCATRVKPPAAYPDPNYDYAVAVCDALMEAILEGTGPLRIKEGEWLTVAAANGDPDLTPLLNSPTGYTTYLSIKGIDLLAYRQGRMPKEEARKLVDLTQR